jgi:hypothetical protein
MNNTGSFDENVNGIQFTFCPVYTDDGQDEQITVMTEDHIFRMQRSEGNSGFQFIDKDALAPDIQILETKLSDILKSHEAA